MTRLNRWTVLTGCVAMLAMGGCTQHYNGALTFGVPDRAQNDYDEFSQAHRNMLAEERSPARRGDRAAIFEENPRQQTIRPVSRPVVVPSAGESEGGAGFELISDRGQTAPAVRASRLFGELGSSGAGQGSGVAGTGNLVRVTFTSEGGDFDPAIDVAGQAMVFASTRHSQNPDLYYMESGSSAVTQLTTDPANDEMPDISPDGTKVVFTSDRSGSWDLYIKEIKGQTAMRLTDDAAVDIHPSFSPDGRRVVFSSLNQRTGDWELVLIDVENPANKIFLGPGLFPSWSPVDNRIVYQRARQRGDRRFGIWVISVEGDQATQPTELAASSNAAAITPDWSPDGEHIVFCTVVEPGGLEVDETGPKDIWLMRADGSGRTQLTGGQYENLLPAWGSDGLVYFVSDRAGLGTQNIWGVRPDQALRLAPVPETQLGDASQGGSGGPGTP
ncbi:TolB family protein [Mucisphaera sp.]|uniref:TolB family protein n=1 Tax=Mucisphaera sp. TaxID=2913024 RepID=UPI003D0E814D